MGALATGRSWLTNEPVYINLRLKHRVGVLTRNLAVGLLLGLMFGPSIVLGLSFAHELAHGLAHELTDGLRNDWAGRLAWTVESMDQDLRIDLALGLAAGAVVGLVTGLLKWAGTPSRVSWVSSPNSTYKATRMLTILQVSLIGLAVGLPVGVLYQGGWWPIGLVFGGIVGLPVGLAMLSSGAWLSYMLALLRLTTSRQLPLRLMDFLDDAYRLGLLRTVGPAYQFRHAEFQDHLLQTEKSLTIDRL